MDYSKTKKEKSIKDSTLINLQQSLRDRFITILHLHKINTCAPTYEYIHDGSGIAIELVLNKQSLAEIPKG